MNATFVREGFLRETLRLTQFPNTLSERAKQTWKGIVHSTSVRGMTCLCLHCLHRHHLHGTLIASEIEGSRGIGKEIPAMKVSSLYGGGGGGGGGIPQTHRN